MDGLYANSVFAASIGVCEVRVLDKQRDAASREINNFVPLPAKWQKETATGREREGERLELLQITNMTFKCDY